MTDFAIRELDKIAAILGSAGVLSILVNRESTGLDQGTLAGILLDNEAEAYDLLAPGIDAIEDRITSGEWKPVHKTQRTVIGNALLRCTQDSRASEWLGVSVGDVVVFSSVSEDELNYYAHGLSNEMTPGIHSSYLTLPKFGWVLKTLESG